MKAKYQIFNPAGNITALVIGDQYTLQERQKINEAIMRENPQVEQVGFVSTKEKKLTMAGEEFCGNGLRSAVLYYRINRGTIKINQLTLKSGIEDNGEVWCKIPISNTRFQKLDQQLYQISIYGITIVVVKKEIQGEVNIDQLKERANNIIQKYHIDDKAIGIMFCKNNRIYPIVWVKEVNTFFAENACGSGTVAVTLLDAVLCHQNQQYRVIQLSGDFLDTKVILKKNYTADVILKGKIDTVSQIKEIEIDQ